MYTVQYFSCPRELKTLTLFLLCDGMCLVDLSATPALRDTWQWKQQPNPNAYIYIIDKPGGLIMLQLDP